ncbi:hypothetical protein Slin15195_G086590 [Septoria linicola]|uniref:Uncharacterized protein n=1 Tax=Septoria linicola TaxID=215465 RepID=A0A9Q9AUF5_9PEZI|nr:hypothetical protein Slin14017_G089180 [Septoria linicola]USW55340.1 hypothetical protein Slin15195_G086590 [Septoria linicola]
MASSRFHEHFSETSSEVHVRPPSFTAPRTIGNRKRVLSRIQERPEPMQKRQTSTLNCNGLAFRHTTFVPDPDMVQFTIGAGSKPAPGEQRKGHRRNKTPTTLATLAGFYLLPYALRKAAISSRERLEAKERKKKTRENTKLATGRHDSAIGSDPKLATPSLGSTLDIQIPQTFENVRDSSSSGITFEPVFNDSNENWQPAGDDDDNDLTTAGTSSLSSVCTGERMETIGTRLSDLPEVSEISEVPEEVSVPMPSGPTLMLVRGWSSSSGEEELSPGPPKGKGRTWKEI